MISQLVKEQDRVTMFIKFLNARDVNCWRNNTIKAKLASGNWINNGKEGTPDIVGFLPAWHKLSGGFLGIEVKKDGKNLDDPQVLFAKEVRQTEHGLYIVARQVEDLLEPIFGVKVEPLPFGT